jgi:hypothetical protein
LIKQKVVYLISALSMVWDCHFNLLEPIWMHEIVPWSFFFFFSLCLEMRKSPHPHVSWLVRMRARFDLADFFCCLNLFPLQRLFLSICPEMPPFIRFLVSDRIYKKKIMEKIMATLPIHLWAGAGVGWAKADQYFLKLIIRNLISLFSVLIFGN